MGPTRLPILAGSWLVWLAGLDLCGDGVPRGWRGCRGAVGVFDRFDRTHRLCRAQRPPWA